MKYGQMITKLLLTPSCRALAGVMMSIIHSPAKNIAGKDHSFLHLPYFAFDLLYRFFVHIDVQLPQFLPIKRACPFETSSENSTHRY